MSKKNKMLQILKDNVNLDFNADFFELNTVLSINTGGGKTYNTGYSALDTVFNKTCRQLISTTKNENVEDLCKEIIKILKKVINDNELTRPILERPDILQILGIYRMTSYAQLDKKILESFRIIITNHSYLFSNGHSGKLFTNTQSILEIFTSNDIIIIDEVDELEKRAIATFQVSGFLQKCKSTHEIILKNASNFLKAYEQSYYKSNTDQLRYEIAEETKRIRYTKEGEFDTPTYSLDVNSNYKALDLIYKCFKFVCKNIDYGWRDGIKLKTSKGEYRILRIDVVESLVFDPTVTHIDIESDELLCFIKNNQGAIIKEQIIRIYNNDEDYFDIDNPYEFIEWCKEHLSTYQYDILYSKLSIEGSDLFKKYISVRKTCVLDMFDCQKYYLTATPFDLEYYGYNVKPGRYNRQNSIERIEIFNIKSLQSNDSAIKKILIDYCTKYSFNSLGFMGRKEKMDKLLKQKSRYKEEYHKNIRIATSIYDGTCEMQSTFFSLNEGSNHEVNYKNCTLGYLNGVESTGKNYADTRLLVLNSKPNINVLGRTIILKDSNIINPIEKASMRTIIQATGRIDRNTNLEEKYKSIIFVGDRTECIQELINYKKQNGSNTEYIFNQNESIELKENGKFKLDSLLNYIKAVIDNDIEGHFNIEMENRYNDIIENKKHLQLIKLYLMCMQSNGENKIDAVNTVITKFKIKKSSFYKILNRYINTNV